MTSPPRAPEVPGYAILGLLGSGGLGAVWRARNSTGAIVALKVVEPRRPVDAATADRLFRREALAGLNLDHPGIVRALDAVKARDGRPCIVFELAEGPTLRDAVKQRGVIPPEEVLPVARNAAAALDYAHRHGVVHGDVSPGNVLLAPAGARLLDFGLVTELEAEPGGSVWATPGFTAPEVMAGGAPTAASDLYALGRTMAFALKGADHPLRAVVERLCRADPAARYRSAAELGLDLDAIAAGETPLGAALSGAKARMAARRKGPWILAACTIAAVVGWALLRGNGTEPVPPTPAVVQVVRPEDPVAGKIRALQELLLLEPVDFAAARALAGELRGVPAARSVIDKMEILFSHAAAEVVQGKEARARTAFIAGDRDGWRRALLEWPSGFEDVDGPTSTRSVAARMRAEVGRVDRDLAAADRRLDEIEKTIADMDPAAAEAWTVFQEMDTELGRFLSTGFPGDVHRRVAGLAPKVKSSLEAAQAAAGEARAKREKEIGAAVRAFLDAAATPESPARVQALLTEAIKVADGTQYRVALEGIALGARRAQGALEREFARVAGRPWAGFVDGKPFVGVLPRAPAPETVLWTRIDFEDVFRLSGDRKDGARWLVLQGWAYFMAQPDRVGEIERQVLVLGSRGKERDDGNTPSYWQRLNADPREPSWGAAVGKAGARPEKNPPKDRAVEAFVGDDMVGAWAALQEAWAVDPDDAELSVLGARVLMAASRPLPTRRIRFQSLELAERAWGLDPKLAAGPALVTEIALGIHDAYDASSGTGFIPVATRALKASISLGRATTRDLQVLAEKLHREGNDPGARIVLEAARELRVPMPGWAADWFR